MGLLGVPDDDDAAACWGSGEVDLSLEPPNQPPSQPFLGCDLAASAERFARGPRLAWSDLV